MPSLRRILVPFATAALLAGASGCSTDDAIERDAKEATQDVKEAGEEAGRDIERAIPGDSDEDGR